MIALPHDIRAEMSEWPRQWNGKETDEGWKILTALTAIWSSVEQAGFNTETRENCLRTPWIMGFELNRDFLLDAHLPKEVPIGRRITSIIEDGGPLLFAFYSDSDTSRFETGCEQIELALRRSHAWAALTAPPQ